MSVPRFQKINFGTYDNYIPVSELSKKSWNQQHFALRFPKPPRPGTKRRSKPSQLRDNTVFVYDADKLKEASKRPLWMHSSLMRISERPSDYLAARSQPPYKSYKWKGDAKVADVEKPTSPVAGKKDKDKQAHKDNLESETESTVLKEPKITKREPMKDKDIERGTKGEKDVAKTDAKKEKKDSKKGKESGTESEDDKKGPKKERKKERKASKKGKESATESEDDKKDTKKDAKKEKKGLKKSKESATESEDEKKDAKKEKKGSKKSKGSTIESEDEKKDTKMDKDGKKDSKKLGEKDDQDKKDEKKASGTDIETKDDAKKGAKKGSKKDGKKDGKKDTDTESADAKKDAKKKDAKKK
ncbi:cylicin-2 [Vulpes vulpes]|uniref:Cylicin-2 n=1 Tax=Vulpes vulpes TaxID=9627 RepID=A0ABM4YCJ0_VULVU